MLKKILGIGLLLIVLVIAGYITIAYYFTFSDGDRSGELIKFSRKGYVFKTYEGEISQGISGAKMFQFSVMDNQPEVIQKMKELQGKYVKVHYEERMRTFAWWGDSNYFVTSIEEEKSPHQLR